MNDDDRKLVAELEKMVGLVGVSLQASDAVRVREKALWLLAAISDRIESGRTSRHEG